MTMTEMPKWFQVLLLIKETCFCFLESKVFFICGFFPTNMLTGWFQSVRGPKWLNWNKPKPLQAKPIFGFLQASVVEDEGLWSIGPRSRRALGSMLLCLPDVHPIVVSSFSQFSQNAPKCFMPPSLCSYNPFCLHCPSFHPLASLSV